MNLTALKSVAGRLLIPSAKINKKKPHTGLKHWSVLFLAVDGFIYMIQLCVLNIKYIS